MKTASTLLKALMAILIAFLPFQAEAKPKKEGKKRAAAAEVRKHAPKQARQRAARQAPKRQQQRISKAPQQRRAPQIRTAPKRPKQSPAVVRQQRAPKRAQHAVAQAPRRVKERPPQAQRAQAKVRKDRADRIQRDIAQPNVDRTQRARKEARVKQGLAAAAGAGVGAAVAAGERDRDQARDIEGKVDGRGPRADRDGQKQNLVAGTDDRDRKERRDRDGKPGRRDKVDRRPPRVDTPEEIQRRTARAQVREKAKKERKRHLAQRAERNRDKVQKFRQNRQRRLAAVQLQRQRLRTTRLEARREYLEDAREEIRDYWEDRADDLRDRLDDRRDDLFDDDWWEERYWRHRPVVVSNPWWWWRPAQWSTVNVFLDAGWSEPVVYDYGTDVIYDESTVYVRGEPVGTPVQYSQRVIELANPEIEEIAEAPVVESDWTPLGVWALVQEDQGDAVMFFQLSVDKKGFISGAYVNVVSGEELPVVGQVDRATQRAAWHIGDETEKVFEAGMANLTQPQASCMVHVSPGEMQPWLLVRMESPDLPEKPTDVSPSTTSGASAALNP